MCLVETFLVGNKWANFEKKLWITYYKWVILSKLGRLRHFELNT